MGVDVSIEDTFVNLACRAMTLLCLPFSLAIRNDCCNGKEVKVSEQRDDMRRQQFKVQRTAPPLF